MSLNVPNTIYAGESIKFNQTFAEFKPSDGWILDFAVGNGIVKYSIVSTPDLDTDSWNITVLPSITKDYVPANYTVYARVTKDTESYVLPITSSITVKGDPFSGNGTDNRTFNERMVDILEAAYEERASENVLEITLYQRQIKGYTRAEQLKYLNYFKQEVAKEKLKEATQSKYGSNLMYVVG